MGLKSMSKKPIQREIKNILVTGGAGFIGSSFIRHVLTNESEFKGTILNIDALTYAGNLENLKEVEKDRRYFFQKVDIRNQTLISHLCSEYDIDTIIHFAAESHVDRSILGPQDFLETNILGTFALLEVVRKYPNIHFHHVSTDEVYGSLGETGEFSETSRYKPNSPYAASKAASDHFVRSYANTYNLSTCISNCSNNYGPYQFPEKLVPLTIINCLNKDPIPVYGDGKNVRDWLFVDDHAKALWMLLKYGRTGESYNIGGNEEWSNLNLIQEIISVLADTLSISIHEYSELISFVKDRPGHDFRYAIDSTKIQNEIGWNPEHDLRKGIRKTIQWYINNDQWISNVKNGSYKSWVNKNYSART